MTAKTRLEACSHLVAREALKKQQKWELIFFYIVGGLLPRSRSFLGGWLASPQPIFTVLVTNSARISSIRILEGYTSMVCEYDSRIDEKTCALAWLFQEQNWMWSSRGNNSCAGRQNITTSRDCKCGPDETE